MSDIMLHIESVSKQYRLGQIGGTTLRDELQRMGAKLRGKEDPTKTIGAKDYNKGETFMALDCVTFDVKKGERVGIIGHNGAGKSTLLKLISRVTAPTSGRIGLNGRVASMLEVGTGFHPELTGRENIYMNGAILGMTKKEIDAKMEDIIDFSECRQFIDTPVKRYSSGMYVKLAFSVAAHLDSEIMIMDEVLAVGDMAFQKKCLDKMNDISRSDGRTIIYVSHNMATIRQLCDRVVVLDHGTIAFDGDVESGIDIYAGGAGSELPVYYELENSPRPSKQHGVDFIITDFRFDAMNQAIFNRTEPINFSVSINAKKDYDSLRLYLVIKARNDDILGMTQTFEALKPIRAGEKASYNFSLNCSNFAEGEYLFYLDIFTFDGYGKHYSVDHPIQVIRFKIIDNQPSGIDWQEQYFGHIRLNPISIVSGGKN